PRPLRYSPALLRSRFILLLIALVLVLALAVVGVTVFVNQNVNHRNSASVAAKTHLPTPTPTHTPTHTPISTLTPTPTPMPTPTSNPVLAPTSPTAPAPPAPPPPTPTPTRVVPTCSTFGCDGKDPRNDHGPNGIACWNDGSYVVASKLVTYGVVYLWYSKGCGTNWSETLQTGGTSYIADANITRGSDNRRYESIRY